MLISMYKSTRMLRGFIVSWAWKFNNSTEFVWITLHSIGVDEMTQYFHTLCSKYTLLGVQLQCSVLKIAEHLCWFVTHAREWLVNKQLPCKGSIEKRFFWAREPRCSSSAQIRQLRCISEMAWPWINESVTYKKRSFLLASDSINDVPIAATKI